MIHPAPYGVDDDGHLQIDSAATLLLAIKPVDDEGKITCVSGTAVPALRARFDRIFTRKTGFVTLDRLRA